eukprot:TRINITY_DN34002_c1_g1_i1.p1 TRINITY_DN34002_c1_g1~~TRINITY_DN34002_c1_g1_i1.p1  ORF type:complete len:102 (-),score=7.20 TRINITY_DN34002_c1_g1_i1:415-720(-)
MAKLSLFMFCEGPSSRPIYISCNVASLRAKDACTNSHTAHKLKSHNIPSPCSFAPSEAIMNLFKYCFYFGTILCPQTGLGLMCKKDQGPYQKYMQCSFPKE